MKDLTNGKLNKDLESVDKFYSKNPELNKLPDQTKNRIREEFEDMFPRLFVQNNPSGSYLEIANNLIPDFFLSRIDSLLKSQKESLIEKIENIRNGAR